MAVSLPSLDHNVLIDLEINTSFSPLSVELLNMTTLRSMRINVPADGWKGTLELNFKNRTITDQAGRDRSVWLDRFNNSLWRSDPLVVGANDLRVSKIGRSPAAKDDFEGAAGALTGRTLKRGGTWQSAGSSASSFSLSGSGEATRTSTVAEASPDQGKLMTPSSISVGGGEVSLQWKQSNTLAHPLLLARYKDISNFLVFDCFDGTVKKRVAGTYTTLATASRPGTLIIDRTYKAVARVLGDGSWYFWAGADQHDPVAIASGVDSALSAGGALGSGRPGFGEQMGSGSDPRFYDEFLAESFVPIGASVANARLRLRKEYF